MHELEKLIDMIYKRDENAVRELNENAFYNGGVRIEERIMLADGRAHDALLAVRVIANYIMRKELGASLPEPPKQEQSNG
jgi:hypothetical protein